MTIGVLSRVMDLADRKSPVYPQGSPEVFSLTPLPKLLSEITGVGENTKTVMTHYLKCVQIFGSELNVLLETPVNEIAREYSPILAEAIKRIRGKKVIRKPGYDGKFGTVTVFKGGEKEHYAGEDEVILCKKKKKAYRKQ